MRREPGHKAGHDASEPAGAGFHWADYIESLVESHGSLAALAEKVSRTSSPRLDAATVERGLRRLRARGEGDGGTHGRRLLELFGVPQSIEARARWMGVYHSRFTDLPVALCADQLTLWDRAPLNESRARIWLSLGFASLALRRAEIPRAQAHLAQARLSLAGAGAAARVELALVEAFVASRVGTREGVAAHLEEAGRGIESEGIDPDDRACFRARWLDQRGYQFNHPAKGAPPDHAAARRLYEQIPVDGPPFARCRRASGLAYAYWQQGDREAAIASARAACESAGDGGFLRLRAMSLNMLGKILGDAPGGDEARARGLAIARQLEDEALAARFTRAR